MDLADELLVVAEVLGTTDPPTMRRLRVHLEPGPSATKDQDHLCPIVTASAEVNGTPLMQTSAGQHFVSGGGWLSGSAGCETITFEIEIPHDPPFELLKEPTKIVIEDNSGAVAIEGRALLAASRASFIMPADGVMRPGSRAKLDVEPSADVLPFRLTGDYLAEIPERSFGLSPVATAEGLAFDIPAGARSSAGTIRIEGDGYDSAFRGIVDGCKGARDCEFVRGACYDFPGCPFGIYRGPGFDVIELPASVMAP